MAESAENRIGFEDIFKDDIFTPVRQAGEALAKILDEIEKRLKELQKQIIEAARAAEQNANGLREVLKAIQGVRANSDALTKIQQQRVKLEEKLKALQNDVAKETEKLKFQIRDVTAEYKRRAAAETAAERATKAQELANNRLNASYADLSNALNDLRERYKDLVVQGKANTEEAAKLRDAIVKLDRELKEIDFSVGQFQRNVGNYAQSFKEALTDFFRGAGPAGQAVLGLGFAAQRAGDAFRAAGGGVKGFVRAVVEGGRALRGVGLLLILEAISKLASFGKGLEALEKAKERIDSLREEIRLNEQLAAIKLRLEAQDATSLQALRERERLLQRQAQLELELIAQERARVEREKAKIEEELKDVEDSLFVKLFRGLGQAFGALVRGLAQVVRAVGELAGVFNEDLGRRIRGFAGTIESAAVGVERFFSNIQADKAAELTDKLADAENRLSELRIKEAEVTAKLRKEQEELAKQREELIQSTLDSLNVEVEAVQTQREALKREYAKRISDLENAYEAAKKVLEGNDAALLEAQRRYLASLSALEAEFARKDGEILAESAQRLAKIRAELQQDALISEVGAIRERYDALIEEVRKSAAELESDEVELLQRLEEAKTRAIIAAQLRAADADIKFREELAKARLETERGNFATEEDFAKYRERRLLEIQIEAARERLKVLGELYRVTGEKQLELEIAQTEALISQLNAKLKALSDAALDQQKAIIKEYLQALDALADAFDSYLKRVEERALSGLERQRGTLQRRIAVFEGLAKEGALAASESIAALEAQEAELVQRQEQLKRRAQRREFALAAVKTYVQLLERGAPNALAQTIRDITLLTQLISKLPTFYEGTEYVRDGMRIPNAVRDALIVRVHEGERIVPAHINRQLRGVKNEDLPKLVAGGEVSFDYDRFLDTLDVVLRKQNSVKRVRRRL
jgi:acyl-CoA thioesterase FadM/molybdopterin converting factor small subunit